MNAPRFTLSGTILCFALSLFLTNCKKRMNRNQSRSQVLLLSPMKADRRGKTVGMFNQKTTLLLMRSTRL